MEKFGDWVCFKCRNINFSYRTNCNRCNIAKLVSTKIGLELEASRIITKDLEENNINSKSILNNKTNKQMNSSEDINERDMIMNMNSYKNPNKMSYEKKEE